MIDDELSKMNESVKTEHEGIRKTVVANRSHEFRRVVSEIRCVRMFYKSWTQALQNLGFERVQTSFCWQGHRKMIRQLGRSEKMSSYVDPRIGSIQ